MELRPLAAVLRPLVRSEAVANTIGFLFIALLVMGLASTGGHDDDQDPELDGAGLRGPACRRGFRIFSGSVAGDDLAILVTVAFFPQAQWLVDSRLPRHFFGACHVSTHMSPAELADRVRAG